MFHILFAMSNKQKLPWFILWTSWSHLRTECAFIVTFAVIVTAVLYFAGRINQTWKFWETYVQSLLFERSVFKVCWKGHAPWALVRANPTVRPDLHSVEFWRRCLFRLERVVAKHYNMRTGKIFILQPTCRIDRNLRGKRKLLQNISRREPGNTSMIYWQRSSFLLCVSKVLFKEEVGLQILRAKPYLKLNNSPLLYVVTWESNLRNECSLNSQT